MKRIRMIRNAIMIAAMSIVMTIGLMPPVANADENDKVLRVCQDPNNLPFSNRNRMGFENKIAEFFGQELGWKVEYTWYPQRMGFIRNTLRGKLPNSENYKCDLVTSVATGFDMGATTRPYYHSTYAMVYVKGKGLDNVKSLEDLAALDPAKRKSLRLGIFARSPVADWLLQNGMIDQIVSYQTQTGDPNQYPGQIIEQDLPSGKIDIAFVWGPIAGYFAKNSKTVPITVVPLKPRSDMKFDFSIAMATRYGEKPFHDRIDQLIEKNQQKIKAILLEYGVPLVDERGEVIVPALTR
jgi:mxaJ protein